MSTAHGGPYETRGYSPGGGGQIHWRMWQPSGKARERDLVCLHPAPFSGLAYRNLAPLLAGSRRVIAPDYPGYGGSDSLDQPPSIADYSAAMEQVAWDLCGDEAVDALGFHTGCLVAAEWALRQPRRVRKACLIDIPAYEPDAAQAMIAKFSQPFVAGDDLSSLEAPWKSTYLARRETQGEEQGFGMLVEQLRAGSGMNSAFHAAFSYPWAERFPRIACETLVIATQSGLLDGTRSAAKLIPDANLGERLDIKRSVLDESAQKTAREVLAFLEQIS